MNPTEEQRENIVRTIDRLKSIEDDNFDMGTFIDGVVTEGKSAYDCNTVACLAGWAVLECATVDEVLQIQEEGLYYDFETKAMDLLGIRYHMFYTGTWPEALYQPLANHRNEGNYEYGDEEFVKVDKAIQRKQVIEYLECVLDGTAEEKYPQWLVSMKSNHSY